MLLSSCTKYSDFEKKNSTYVLRNHTMGLSDLKNIEWKVGSGLKRQKVSKGFRVKVTLPQAPNSQIWKMHEEKQVDSWLLRVRKRKSGGVTKLLGYMYMPLIKTNPRSKDKSPADADYLFLQIVYAAAGPSKRFENFKCPAFGHNKLIKKLSIKKTSNRSEALVVSRTGDRLQAIANKVELTPVQFPTGMSLIGTYSIEIAFFNSKTKEILSNYIALSDAVEVEEEEDVYLKGCAGATIPEREGDEEKNKSFKFGR